MALNSAKHWSVGFGERVSISIPIPGFYVTIRPDGHSPASDFAVVR